MNAQDHILGRIRKALAISAPRPGAHHLGHLRPAGLPTHPEIEQVLPATGRNFEENLALFRKNAAELRADFFTVQNQAEVLDPLLKLSKAEGWKKAATHKGALTDAVSSALGLPLLLTNGGYNVHELETCDVAITECDALIAQTGSVLVTSRSTGGRGLTVLPPHHVVLARRDQLVPGLPDAFALIKKKYSPDYPSMISFITGPSRTGDIERILVLGAHGPKRLTIFCL